MPKVYEDKYDPKLQRAIKEEPYEPSPEELEEMFAAQEEQREGLPDELPYDEESIDINSDLNYKDNNILLHCKPVYNFQSAEFDMVVDYKDPESMNELENAYIAVLAMLQRVAVDQPAQVKPRALPSEEDRPTPKMLEIMDRFGIEHNQYTTKKQAQALIEKSIKENK